jgi:hypothetical protein
MSPPPIGTKRSQWNSALWSLSSSWNLISSSGSSILQNMNVDLLGMFGRDMRFKIMKLSFNPLKEWRN